VAVERLKRNVREEPFLALESTPSVEEDSEYTPFGLICNAPLQNVI
jgi:hypothetical protein